MAADTGVAQEEAAAGIVAQEEVVAGTVAQEEAVGGIVVVVLVGPWWRSLLAGPRSPRPEAAAAWGGGLPGSGPRESSALGPRASLGPCWDCQNPLQYLRRTHTTEREEEEDSSLGLGREEEGSHHSLFDFQTARN